MQLVDESRRLVLLRQNGVAKVQVPYVLANWLRPHQRLGVQFMFNCVAGISLPPFTGCILADDVSSQICMLFGLCLLLTLKNNTKTFTFFIYFTFCAGLVPVLPLLLPQMGLGKTLQSITLIYTLLMAGAFETKVDVNKSPGRPMTIDFDAVGELRTTTEKAEAK